MCIKIPKLAILLLHFETQLSLKTVNRATFKNTPNNRNLRKKN